MATDPSFASTVRTAVSLLGTAETNLQVPTQAATVLTAGAGGTKVEEICVEASATSLVATTVAGLVYIYLHDGTTAHLYDVITITANTASSSAAPFRVVRGYANLWIPSGWSLRASQSIAGNANLLKLSVFGGDY